MTTAGKNLTTIRRVTVYRTVEPLPVLQPGETDRTTNTTPQPIAAFAKIPPLSPAQFVKLRSKVESIEGANLPAASSGARLTFEDSPEIRTSHGRPVRLTYAVVTEGPNATGDLSNLASIVPLAVPVPPTALAAVAKPEGVVLTWSEPKANIAGYNIYRLPKDEILGELTRPVNSAPVSKMTYTDVPPYGTYTYIVTAAAASSIESDPSSAVTATFKDLTPPPIPKNVSVLTETKAVRLIWDPVDAPDLAGYMVWRKEGVGQGDQIKEIPTIVPLFEKPIATSYYVDAKADIGIAYKYAVTSVDKSGNQSELVWTDWVVIPKTP